MTARLASAWWSPTKNVQVAQRWWPLGGDRCRDHYGGTVHPRLFTYTGENSKWIPSVAQALASLDHGEVARARELLQDLADAFTAPEVG